MEQMNDYAILDNVLGNVCTQILEELAFIFCEPQDAATVDYSRIKDAHVSTITFTGPRDGKIEIASGQNLCLLLSSNMLGIEPEEEDASTCAADALGEALNVICGRFLTEAYGEEVIFSLSAPQKGAVDDLSNVAENAEAEFMQFFEAEGYCLVVKLTIYKLA